MCAHDARRYGKSCNRNQFRAPPTTKLSAKVFQARIARALAATITIVAPKSSLLLCATASEFHSCSSTFARYHNALLRQNSRAAPVTLDGHIITVIKSELDYIRCIALLCFKNIEYVRRIEETCHRFSGAVSLQLCLVSISVWVVIYAQRRVTSQAYGIPLIGIT